MAPRRRRAVVAEETQKPACAEVDGQPILNALIRHAGNAGNASLVCFGPLRRVSRGTRAIVDANVRTLTCPVGAATDNVQALAGMAKNTLLRPQRLVLACGSSSDLASLLLALTTAPASQRLWLSACTELSVRSAHLDSLALQAVAAALPGLRTLELHACTLVGTLALAGLAGLSSLQSISADKGKIALGAVTQLTSLTALRVSESMGVANLPDLAGLPLLETLDLKHVANVRGWPQQIVGCQALQVLQYSPGWRVDPRPLPALATTHLRHLRLGGTTLGFWDCQQLAQLPALASLRVWDVIFTANPGQAIFSHSVVELQGLQILQLGVLCSALMSDISMPGETWQSLARLKLPQLQRLVLTKGRNEPLLVPDNWWELTTPQVLQLTQQVLKGCAWLQLPGLHMGRVLNAWRPTPTVIQASSQVCCLELRESKLLVETVACIPDCVQKLTVWGNKWEAGCAAALARLPGLQHITIKDEDTFMEFELALHAATLAGLLCNSQRVVTMSLGHTSVSPKAIRELQAELDTAHGGRASVRLDTRSLMPWGPPGADNAEDDYIDYDMYEGFEDHDDEL